MANIKELESSIKEVEDYFDNFKKGAEAAGISSKAIKAVKSDVQDKISRLTKAIDHKRRDAAKAKQEAKQEAKQKSKSKKSGGQTKDKD